MSTFKKYPKIHRLGKEEVEGILEGECHIQEKLDGANTSVWINKEGELTCGSRNRELTEGFNGFVDYIKQHEGVSKLLADHPKYRLYGEWLVRHTVQYNELAYKKFYLFDITVISDDEEQEDYLTTPEVNAIADKYGVDRPEYHGVFTNPRSDVLDKFIGISSLGDKGEGITIKNPEFLDKFGNHNYAKIVTEKFKEDNAVTFGGNNKHSDCYWEVYISNKYVTLPRVEKIMNKIQPTIDEKLDFQHTPRVAQSVYHDMLTEEIWEIAKKADNISFKTLSRVCTKKAIKIYHDILNEHISIAYK